MAYCVVDRCYASRDGMAASGGPLLPPLTQAVWKRFSYPNSCKQTGAMDLDATG
jgi:hypothetical protein